MDDQRQQHQQHRQFRTSPSSRERNRVHAQRTRQRKKEQMMDLQNRAAELKQEQIGLKQTINEKSTATILVDLFATGKAAIAVTEFNASTATTAHQQQDDPLVEALLKRPIAEIPDASQIPELPALILPGQHASKKMKAQSTGGRRHQKKLSENSDSRHEPHVKTNHDPTTMDETNHDNNNNDIDNDDNDGDDDADDEDGIDYELLGRDRSQCSPQELDQIRRERNRMHAKRTRDRKRLFTEQLALMCRRLEDENLLLHEHLQQIDPDYTYQRLAERTPIPDIGIKSTQAARKRSYDNKPSPQQHQQEPLFKKKRKTTTTTQRRKADAADGDSSNNNNHHNNVLFFDTRMSTLLMAVTAASRQTDDYVLHEISDSCSATVSDEPDHHALEA